MRNHTECEKISIKSDESNYDYTWRGGGKTTYWKLKENITIKIKELVHIQDGCSTKSGILSQDNKLYCVHGHHQLRLEAGEKVILKPDSNFYPKFHWRVERI